MSTWLKFTLISIVILGLVAYFALALVTRSQALDIVNHPPEERPEIKETPED